METLRLSTSITRFDSSSSTTLRRRKLIIVNSFKPIYYQPLFSSVPPKSYSILNLIRPRHLKFVANSIDSHHHHEDHHHHHEHHHHHRHHGCDDHGELTRSQEAFLQFAKAIKWTDMVNFLRENLVLCCFSAVLFLAAAACPYLVPKPSV